MIMKKRKYIRFSVGDIYGRLSILSINKGYAVCKCDCGKEKRIRADGLRNGSVISCGCYHRDVVRKSSTTHGQSNRSKTYSSWSAMIQRCTNEKNINYKSYGGKGIKVCYEWLTSFEVFYKDMGERMPGMTLDRINNNGHYCKENCRWASREDQDNNKTKKHEYFINGVFYSSISDAAKSNGVSVSTIYNWCRGYKTKTGKMYSKKDNCYLSSILGFA